MEPWMTVIIPTPESESPAFRALQMEGEDAQEVLCSGSFDYGREFSRLWNLGQPFVICEWDVIPWPGAVAALLDCPESWCNHRYPLHRGKLANSFGIGKYRPSGSALEEWAETPWHLLDGFVVPELLTRIGRPHVHEPPVAHARKVPTALQDQDNERNPE